MQEESLRVLMMCSMNGPPLMEFDIAKFIDQWYLSNQTTKHVRGQKRPKKGIEKLKVV
jgi:hypothetical protein